jgi:hypothetical protein
VCSLQDKMIPLRRVVAQFESTRQILPISWQGDDSPAEGSVRVVGLAG